MYWNSHFEFSMINEIRFCVKTYKCVNGTRFFYKSMFTFNNQKLFNLIKNYDQPGERLAALQINRNIYKYVIFLMWTMIYFITPSEFVNGFIVLYSLMWWAIIMNMSENFIIFIQRLLEMLFVSVVTFRVYVHLCE